MRSFDPVIERCEQRYGGGSDAVRLFHGRGHAFEGYEDVTVDVFPPYVLVGSFGDDDAGALRLADRLREALPGVAGIAVQLRAGRRTQVEVPHGRVPDRIVTSEDGLRFIVRPLRNQNVGLFLDMAPARRWVRESALGGNVLNLFAYTCTFSVAALAGGAEQVVNNDMSRAALDWGAENHAENEQDTRRVRMLPHNLFKSWWKIRQWAPYDLVIVDPPTNQGGSFNAEKQYGQILKRLRELTRPGGRVLACLNSPFLNRDFLPAQMSRWCPECQFEGYLANPDDFPDRYPDRALKVGVFTRSG